MWKFFVFPIRKNVYDKNVLINTFLLWKCSIIYNSTIYRMHTYSYHCWIFGSYTYGDETNGKLEKKRKCLSAKSSYQKIISMHSPSYNIPTSKHIIITHTYIHTYGNVLQTNEQMPHIQLEKCSIPRACICGGCNFVVEYKRTLPCVLWFFYTSEMVVV